MDFSENNQVIVNVRSIDSSPHMVIPPPAKGPFLLDGPSALYADRHSVLPLLFCRRGASHHAFRWIPHGAVEAQPVSCSLDCVVVTILLTTAIVWLRASAAGCRSW